MESGFLVAIAWPETKCKQAGAWYDGLMESIGASKNGYYKVGHAALMLVSDHNPAFEYFDFGRYHAPHGKGRVRSNVTDHDLRIESVPQLSDDGEQITNLEQAMKALFENKSFHGDGPVYTAVTRVNYEKAAAEVKAMQDQEFLSYGPFVTPGTNCSRFVSRIARKSTNSWALKFKLFFQYSISPSPWGNLKAITHRPYCYGKCERRPVVVRRLIASLMS